MRLNELRFHKAIYPRGLDKLVFDNITVEQKPDEENIEKLVDALKTDGVDHKITYNKHTMHIVDGTHLWLALQRIHTLNWTVPDRYLKEIDIDESLEMFYAGVYNSRHGKSLSRDEIKAIIKSYMNDDGTVKYGLQTKFSTEYNIPLETIKNWIAELRHGVSRKTKADTKLKEDIHDIEASFRDKIDQLEDEIRDWKNKYEDVNNKWEHRVTKCPKCGNQIL